MHHATCHILAGAVLKRNSSCVEHSYLVLNQAGANTAQMDLTLDMTEEADAIFGSLEFATDLFKRSTIERMASHLEVSPACRTMISVHHILTKECKSTHSTLIQLLVCNLR